MPALSPSAPWCHFKFSVKDAPEWLQLVSKEAQLEKSDVSMNFLYMSRKGSTNWGAVRTISEAFKLHGGRGQYACSDKGLTLVDYGDKNRPLFPGQTIVPQWPANLKKDLKSGAVILPFKGQNK